MQRFDNIDTIHADTLTGFGMNVSSDSISTHVDLPEISDIGFFAGNPLLHPELSITPDGFAGETPDYALRQDSIISIMLIVGMLLLIYLCNTTFPFVRYVLHDILFRPQPGRTKTDSNSVSMPRLTLIHLVTSITCGTLCYGYTLYGHTVLIPFDNPYLPILVFSGVIMVFFTVRRIAYNFVNWVFYPDYRKKYWNEVLTFSTIIELFLFYLTSVIVMYLKLTAEDYLTLCISIVILVKLVLFYKCFQIFFANLYGIIHIFMYLCALEVMPLLALWQIFIQITQNLIVKN